VSCQVGFRAANALAGSFGRRTVHTHRCQLLLLGLVVLLVSGCRSAEQLDSWPLFVTEPESVHRPGRLRALGPLVQVDWKDSYRQWGVWPLFSVRNCPRVPEDEWAKFDVPYFSPPPLLTPFARREPPQAPPGEGRPALQVLVLFPFIRHESCGPARRNLILPIYWNNQNRYRDGAWWHVWTLFPFYWGGNSSEDGPFHALFPLGGIIKNQFGRDVIRFVLFPLYSHTTSMGRESYSVLYPFFNYATGGDRDRWRIWPFVGRVKRQNRPPMWFFLWPFFWYTEPPEAGERANAGTTALFPFWGTMRSGGLTRTNILWPFYSRVTNDVKQRTDIVAPWPIFRHGQGPDYYRFQIWPLIGTYGEAHVKRTYVLWPLWRTERRETERRLVDWRSLFVVYNRRYAELAGPNGEAVTNYRSLLWPFYYYARDRDGNTYLRVLNVRGLPDPHGWDRFYAKIFHVFEHEKRAAAPLDPDGDWRSTRALWGGLRYDRDDRGTFLRIFPLFSTRTRDGRRLSFEALMGAFGYVDRPGRRVYRILFIPWSIERKGSP
jgi:hypothetical protein